MGSNTYYARVERQDGEMRGAHTNRAWCGRLLSDDLAVIYTDFVDEDDEEGTDEVRKEQEQMPVGSDGVPLVRASNKSSLRIDICSIVTLARVTDPETHEPVVLMRRLRAHRYNLPPNSPVLHRELNKLLSYFNGDFHMAMLSDAYMNLSASSEERSTAGSDVVQPIDEDALKLEKDDDSMGDRSPKKRRTSPVKEEKDEVCHQHKCHVGPN